MPQDVDKGQSHQRISILGAKASNPLLEIKITQPTTFVSPIMFISFSVTNTGPYPAEARWTEMAPLVRCCVLWSITMIILISNFPCVSLY